MKQGFGIALACVWAGVVVMCVEGDWPWRHLSRGLCSSRWTSTALTESRAPLMPCVETSPPVEEVQLPRFIEVKVVGFVEHLLL